MSREFFTIATACQVETIVKGSQFIASCETATTITAAQDFINTQRRTFPDATHHCWAYRLNPQEYRFSDDGEPGGTAGSPILQAITSANLEAVIVVVTRYFGGTKLGAGGLVRAYGGGAAAVIKQAGIKLIKPQVTVQLVIDFADQHQLLHFFSSHPEIIINDTNYLATGVGITIRLFLDTLPIIQDQVINLLRGRVKITNVSAAN
jgi:uncharacterized YigZ family protein